MKPLLPPDPSDKPHMEQQQHPATRAAKPSPIAIETHKKIILWREKILDVYIA